MEPLSRFFGRPLRLTPTPAPTMAAPLSAAQLEQFERAGVVTVDTALTPEQVSQPPSAAPACR